MVKMKEIEWLDKVKKNFTYYSDLDGHNALKEIAAFNMAIHETLMSSYSNNELTREELNQVAVLVVDAIRRGELASG